MDGNTSMSILQNLEEALMLKNPLDRQRFGLCESDEMLAASATIWKTEYVALYEEFQNFQSSVQTLIDAVVTAANHKVTVLEEENQRTKEELQKTKVEDDASCRKLIREKSSLQCEIRTLREELDETRAKLQEKTFQLHESLRWKMDETSNVLRLQGECQDLSHVELSSQLKASEKRNSFLQDEIKNLTDGKVLLLREMDEQNDRYHKNVALLQKNIQDLEHSISQKREEVKIKYNALKDVTVKQKAYILELQESMRIKEEENCAIIADVHEKVKLFMEDSICSMKALMDAQSVNNNNNKNIEPEKPNSPSPIAITATTTTDENYELKLNHLRDKHNHFENILQKVNKSIN